MKRKLFQHCCAHLPCSSDGRRCGQDSAAAAIVIEGEESASADGSAQVLETGIRPVSGAGYRKISADEIYLEAINSDGTQTSVTAEPAVAWTTLLVNGQPVPADTGKTVEQGTTYVALAMARTLDPNVTISPGMGAPEPLPGQSAVLDLTAKVGLVANLAASLCPRGVRIGGRAGSRPLKELVKAFDAKPGWGPGRQDHLHHHEEQRHRLRRLILQPGRPVLAVRVVYAERENQSLDGKIAVANVVLNRVKSPIFTIPSKECWPKKNQFPTSGPAAWPAHPPTRTAS